MSNKKGQEEFNHLMFLLGDILFTWQLIFTLAVYCIMRQRNIDGDFSVNEVSLRESSEKAIFNKFHKVCKSDICKPMMNKIDERNVLVHRVVWKMWDTYCKNHGSNYQGMTQDDWHEMFTNIGKFRSDITPILNGLLKLFSQLEQKLQTMQKSTPSQSDGKL